MVHTKKRRRHTFSEKNKKGEKCPLRIIFEKSIRFVGVPEEWARIKTIATHVKTGVQSFDVYSFAS